MRSPVLSRRGHLVLAATCVAFAVGLLPEARAAAQIGEWTPPVGGSVVRPFVEPLAAYAPGHRGIDFAARPGADVHAANDGVVTFAGIVAGALHVVVSHDGGIRTSYSFLLSIDVRVGDHVQRGQVVGRAGGDGAGHGSGLVHFGVRVGARYVDPMLLFRPRDLTQMVRLVPAEKRAAVATSDPVAERRELERWLASQLDGGCLLCDATDWVADRAGEALDTGLDVLADIGTVGRRWADALDEGLHETLHAIFAVADSARAALLSTPTGRFLQDVVAAGAAFLGWFGRECNENAPPANGSGGSGNVVVAVGGIDSHREKGDNRSFELPLGRLGYARSERYWFSYRKGSVQYSKKDTYGDLHRKARMLGEQLKRAAQEQPGRTFDLMGHSQGGVVVALFLADVYRGHEDEYPPIKNVVTFASPLRGTPLGTTGERLGRNPIGDAVMRGLGATDLPIPDPTATSIRQLAEGSDVIEKITSAGVPKGIHFTSIAAVEDWEVPVRSTELEGAESQQIEVGLGVHAHAEITHSSRALMAARAAIEHRSLPCTSFAEALEASVGSTLLSRAERYGAELIPSVPG